MNQKSLQIFRELTKNVEDINVFKEYIEALYPHINSENAVSYWEDFLDVSKDMIDIYEKLGHPLLNEQYVARLNSIKVTDRIFKDIMEELYRLTVEYLKDFEENIRQCSLCKEKVYYLPLPEEYNEYRIKYQIVEYRSETLNEKEYICPVCGSFDRERLIIAYLEQSQILMLPDINVLQIAPSSAIENYLMTNYPALNYASGDLYMKDVTFQLDIQDMNMISDDSFDVFICSHVLEHVSDDRKALNELYRILKKDGWGILLVPIDLNVLETDEEVGCSEEENWRRFGQGDHVRKYAKQDFINRILDAGFSLDCLGKEFFGAKLFKDNGLSDTAVLYVLRK